MKCESFDYKAKNIQKIIDEAKNFWKIDVEFSVENSETDCLASYYLDTDHIKFHLRYIEENRQKFSELIDEEIKFMIFHEVGHAKEARIYEENGLVWDYITIKAQQSSKILERASKYILRFINAIDDLKVERKLYESGYQKPRTISLITSLPLIEQALKTKSSSNPQEKAIALQICPKILDEIQFSRLSANEKRMITSYGRKFLGGKKRWEEIVKKLETIRFGDIEGYKEIMPEIFYDLFRYKVKVVSAPKKEIELKSNKKYFSGLWKKQNYSYFEIYANEQIFLQ